MNKLLEQIEKKREKLAELLKNPNNAAVLKQFLKYELAYTSNAIEGNTLTRKETVRIIEDKITSSSKPFVYYQEALNHAEAYNKILELAENGTEPSEKELLNIHKIILSGIDNNNAGFYRNCRVSIFGSRAVLPNPAKVPELMEEFFKQLNAADKSMPQTAVEFHYRLVKIHPFADGNGRCARLLMNYLLIKAGYIPIIIKPADRKRYIDNIEKYQLQDDGSAYTKFMLSLLDKSLMRCINIIDIKKAQNDTDRLMTISQFSKYSGAPVSSIRFWVKTGSIEPVQFTISGYMLFAEYQKADIEKILKSSRKHQNKFI